MSQSLRKVAAYEFECSEPYETWGRASHCWIKTTLYGTKRQVEGIVAAHNRELHKPRVQETHT